MIDKQKVQDVINKLLNDEAGFQSGHWSSAKNFADTLHKRGFVPSIALWHQYKFPHGFDEQSFEQYVMQQEYIHVFDADRIMNPEKYIQKFFHGTTVPEQEQRKYLADIKKITENLSDAEKEYVVHYFQTEQPKAYPRLVRYLPELKLLNPQIKNITPKSIFDFMDLYVGMTSRFHPDDIAYFCALQPSEHERAIQDLDKILSPLGVWPNFLMSPDRARRLVDEFIIHKQKSTQRDL